MILTTALELRAIVRPAWHLTDVVRVVTRDDRQDEPIRQAAAAMRVRSEAADILAAVRAMYKQVGIDPTKTRPSSEALLRRVRRGDDLPRINSLVDVINWSSLESQLPFGLYDWSRIAGAVELRIGRPGEEYAGIRKDVVHVAGRMVLSDEEGPFGNPTSDSARTMVTPATTRALVVIFGPAGVAAPAVERALEITRQRIGEFCAAPA